MLHPYILLYRTLLPRRYADYLRRAGGDADKCHETLLHGTFYEEYDLYGFAQKGEAERRTYLTDAVRNRICRKVNSREGDRIMTDKWLTYCHLKEYFHRRAVLLDTEQHIAEAVQLGLSAGSLVLKPTDRCGGRGVQLATATSPGAWSALLAEKRGWMTEQRIVQDERLARWNPSSVNTIRINTFVREGKVYFFTAFIRTGRQGAFIDNGAMGGLFALIDTATGLINTDAFDERGNRYAVHPDSGVPFAGEPIPQWQALTDLCRRMALRMPRTTYVGWDMALTPDGWEPVEANRGEFVAQQTALGRGLRREFEQACGRYPAL